MKDCALAAEAGGAAAVTVHPRYREQMYGGAADHSLTAGVKAALSVSVVANGDITDAESYFAVRRAARADAYMIGRGALGRPWLFGVLGRLDALSDDEIYSGDGGVRPDATAYAEELELKARNAFDACAAVEKHVGILMKIMPERTVANVMKLHLCHYAKNTPHAKAVRLAVAAIKSVDDVFAVSHEYLCR